MLEPAVIALRFAQYVGATALFGGSAFFLYALPVSGAAAAARLPWSRRVLLFSGVLVLFASLAGLIAQTSLLAGSLIDGLKPEMLAAAVTSMAFGPSSLIRACAGGLVVLLAFRVVPGRTLFILCIILGTTVLASFAWMGHGAATRGSLGWLHLGADILHAVAAAAWIGALGAFYGLTRRADTVVEMDAALHNALQGFSTLGSILVAVLIATGVVNSLFLVSLANIPSLWTTPYGQLLSLKLLLFVGMLGLAASNRFRLTPSLGAALQTRTSAIAAKDALRRSILMEATLGLGVLALVAWLGRLAPS